jgi:NADH-quinone oxidoreductase subunit N
MVPQIINSLAAFLPETVLTATFLLVILADLAVRNRNGVLPAIVALLGITAAGLTAIGQHQLPAAPIFSSMLAVDGFSVFFKIVILLSAAIVVVFSLQSDELRSGRRSLGEYYALLTGLTLGLCLMTAATNMLMMYLALELSSLSSYLLSGYTKDARDSSEASLKYVVFGAASSGMMLFGISLLYGMTGSLSFAEINRVLQFGDINPTALLIAGILIIVGFGYKISAVPFHFWAPDVYEGAPITITAFLAVASKAAGFAMLIRFFTITFLDSTVARGPAGAWSVIRGFEWNQILAWVSVLTMTLGNLIAVWQNNLKRLLAYSSIAHAGYMLLGVVVLSTQGMAAVMIYVVMYLFMNLGAFYTVMIVANRTGSEDMDAYKGLGYRAPVVGVAMTIFLLSLTGIPPTAGFVGKFYIFAALISAKWFWLAIVGVLNSVVSLYYYVRILRNMFLREPAGQAEPLAIPMSQIIVMLALVVPTLLLGLYFGPIVEMAQASVGMLGLK